MKHLKTYKIYESGEWSRGIDWEFVKENPENESDEALLIKFMEERLDYIISTIDNKNILEIDNIKGFDIYEGAYAIVYIFGKRYKVWSMAEQSGGVEDTLYIEGFPINNLPENSNPGYVGSTDEISDLLNDINLNGGSIEMYKTTKKYNI